MKARIGYRIYNVIYQIVILFWLLYANTYLNDMVIPESIMWKDNKRRMDTVGLTEYAIMKSSILVVQALVLILLIYFINRIILSGSEKSRIAWRTAKINVIVSLCFIVLLIWGSFRGFLW